MTPPKNKKIHNLQHTDIVVTEELHSTSVSTTEDKIAAIISELSPKHIVNNGDTETAPLTTDERRANDYKIQQMLSCCRMDKVINRLSKQLHTNEAILEK